MLCPAFAVTPADYAKKFSVTVADAVGDKTATDAVIPIRMSTDINFFSYADFQEEDGADLLVTDGNGTALSYEIDMWNPASTTTVWVKVPEIAAGTCLTVYYGGPRNTDNVSTNVWSNFMGVWHFNEESVTDTVANAYDATGNGLTGTDTPRTTSVAGLFGLARQPRGTDYGNSGVGGVFLPPMTFNGRFAISAWYKCDNWNVCPCLFTTKERYDDPGINCLLRGRISQIEVLGDGNSSSGWNSANTGVKNSGTWYRFCVVCNGSSAPSVYTDGVWSGNGNKGFQTMSDSTNMVLAVGNASGSAAQNDQGPGCFYKSNSETGPGRSWVGQIDEFRVADYSCFNVDREYFEGALMKTPSLLEYSPAGSTTGITVVFDATPVSGIAPLEVQFTATVLDAVGGCTYLWDFDGDGVYDATNASGTVTHVYPERSLNTVGLKVMDSDSHEAVVTKEDLITVLTPLTVDCTVPSSEAVTGVGVTFTAVVGNAHAGACSYAWDFDGDGTVDATTTVPTATYAYPARGTYSLTLTVTDSAGDVKSVTKTDFIEVSMPGVVGGKIYVDFDAANDGIGTQENPFNALSSALSVANAGNAIYAKGTCDMSGWTETFTINVMNLVITRWGDAKPVIQSSATTKVCPNALFSLAASGVVLSDIDFRFTRESVGNARPFLSVDAVGCSVARCDFRFTNPCTDDNKTCGFAGIIRVGDGVKSSKNVDLTVSRCSFTDIETHSKGSAAFGDWNFGILQVADGVKMIQNRFTRCSRILGKVSDNWGTPLQFTSNIVVNSTATDVSGPDSGALLNGAWTYFCQGGKDYGIHHFNYNIFLNQDNDGGTVVTLFQKTFQYGALFHNNTVSGYSRFVYDANSSVDMKPGNDWYALFYNNLFDGSEAFYVHKFETPSGGNNQGTTAFTNNVCSCSLFLPEAGAGGYDYGQKFGLGGNYENEGPVPFITLNTLSPNFMGVLRSPEWRWISKGGWKGQITKYSITGFDRIDTAYIGAIDPKSLRLPSCLFFR